MHLENTQTHSQILSTWHLWEMKGSREVDTHASFISQSPFILPAFARNRSKWVILLCLLKQSLREFSNSKLLLHTGYLSQAFMCSFQSYCGEIVGLLVSDPVALFSFHLFFGSFVYFFQCFYFWQPFLSFTSCSSIFS